MKINDFEEEVENVVLDSHILAWSVANRRLPPVGAEIHHTCNEPLCVYPGHLFAQAGEVGDRIFQVGGV